MTKQHSSLRITILAPHCAIFWPGIVGGVLSIHFSGICMEVGGSNPVYRRLLQITSAADLLPREIIPQSNGFVLYGGCDLPARTTR